MQPGSTLKRQVLRKEEIWKSFNPHLEHKNHLGWGKKLHMWEVTLKAAVPEEGITNWYLYRITHLKQIIRPLHNISTTFKPEKPVQCSGKQSIMILDECLISS